MSVSVNKVILIGNLGNDPEVRTAPDKFQVCTFNLATNRDWKDRNTGEQKSQTNWHNVVVWEPNSVTYAKNFLKKGAKVYVEGELETRKWQDKSGSDHYTTEVVIRQNSGQLVGLDGREDVSFEEIIPSDNSSDNGDVPF